MTYMNHFFQRLKIVPVMTIVLLRVSWNYLGSMAWNVRKIFLPAVKVIKPAGRKIPYIRIAL